MANHQKIREFKDAFRLLEETNYSIENPDMFVYNLETFFFVEVKKEKDVLRESQIRFMYLAKSILGIDSNLVYLSDLDEMESQKMIKIEFELPKDLINQND